MELFVIRRLLENAIISLLTFSIIFYFFGVWPYFIFGGFVACVMALIHAKKFLALNVSRWYYLIVGFGDLIMWPAAIVINIRQAK